MAETLKYSELDEWLQAQPENTVDTPYDIILTDVTTQDLFGAGQDYIAQGMELILKKHNPTKYVNFVELDEAVTSIPDWAFKNCDTLIGINLSNIISLGIDAFWKCYNLKNVELPEGLISIGRDAFGKCTSFTEVILPNSLESIGIWAFTGCNNLTYIKLPVNEKFTFINEWDFCGCSSLKSMVIPSNVKTIKNLAFENCKLDYIEFKGETCNINSSGIDSSTILVVPNEYLDSWASLNSGYTFVPKYSTKKWKRVTGSSESVNTKKWVRESSSVQLKKWQRVL